MAGPDSLKMRVAERIDAAEDVVHLLLEPVDSDVRLPAWAPGAHVDLRLGDGIVRQYSLCGNPDDRHFEVAVLRVPGGRGGSERVHEALKPGAELEIAGPRNNFELQAAPEYLFIAGGIGITPIVPMIRAVAARGLPWRLAYGGRTKRSMAFAEQLVAEFGDHVELIPADERGLIDLPALLGDEQPDRRVYCCGPAPLLDAVESLMADRAAESLHVERFSAEVDSSGDAFEVEIASSGKRIQVAEGESIIDALDSAGITVDFSCREGTCGTCETGVLGGVPDHRDSVLDDDEKAANDVMMICVGRCKQGPLLLDL